MPNITKIFKNLWVVWAMWAIKNFVCGPSAAVAFGARPYPGGIKQTANGNRARSQQPYKNLQCSTLVGGNVGSAHKTRWLAGRGVFWPCSTLVEGHVGNVPTRFFLRLKRGLVSIREPYTYCVAT